MDTANISQRDTFWTTVYQLAKEDSNIIIISADMGAPALDKIRKELPSQFINVGISEQNAITIASGLALMGKKVFTYAIAPFITLRCFEQIRVENSMMNIPITIVGVGVGFGYEDSGPTHHLIEDIAIMRSIPNITIHTVTDNVMAAKIAEISCYMTNTNYVRLDRHSLPAVYKHDTDFTEGLGVLREAKEYYIVSTGYMTHVAIEVCEMLRKESVNVGILDVYTIPVNEKLFLKCIEGVKKLITLEEHFLQGGLGSLICEILQDNDYMIPVKRIGLSHGKGYCYKYGGRAEIHKYYGIDKSRIIEEIMKIVKEKNQ